MHAKRFDRRRSGTYVRHTVVECHLESSSKCQSDASCVESISRRRGAGAGAGSPRRCDPDRTATQAALEGPPTVADLSSQRAHSTRSRNHRSSANGWAGQHRRNVSEQLACSVVSSRDLRCGPLPKRRTKSEGGGCTALGLAVGRCRELRCGDRLCKPARNAPCRGSAPGTGPHRGCCRPGAGPPTACNRVWLPVGDRQAEGVQQATSESRTRAACAAHLPGSADRLAEEELR